MHNAAKKLRPAPPVLAYSTVRGRVDGVFLLSGDQGEFRAVRAAGCLLAPRRGDLVLVCAGDDGEAYILNVLRRDGDAPGEIAYEGDLTVKTAGDLRLDAGGDAGVSCAGTMTLAGKTGEAAFEKVSVLARAAGLKTKVLSVMAQTAEQIFSRLTQRADNAVRLVKEHEEVQAGTARYVVEDQLTMHAKNAAHVAEEVIKIDGEQVHLG